MNRFACLFAAILAASFARSLDFAAAADGPSADLAAELTAFDSRVLAGADREGAPQMLERNLSAKLRQANEQSSADWRAIDTKEKWERFRSDKIRALRQSLSRDERARMGDPRFDKLPERPGPPRAEVTGRVTGDHYRIENVLIAGQHGDWITANLYLPKDEVKAKSAPGIVITHSHHSAKTSGELQDMGMLWARVGCAVLVMDQVGYGERRYHPFATEADYPGKFTLGRQPYYFRYDLGIQFHLLGDSLVGWMVEDLRIGVDFLLSRPEVNPEHIILLGSVAGGGDPTAVAGAIDERISVVGPFNFGGPQPETKYPLPEDAETNFNYAGGGSWESTRNLRNSALRGFLPWVIVGSIAPRKLIYGHEFSHDAERDPVWKRLQTIYGFYGAKENLGVAHGRGTLKGQPPEASHCDHIGRVHRQMIHPLLERWCGIKVGDTDAFSARRESKDLVCWTDEAQAKLKPKSLNEILLAQKAQMDVRINATLAQRLPFDEMEKIRWAENSLRRSPVTESRQHDRTDVELKGATATKTSVSWTNGIRIPVLLLKPRGGDEGKAKGPRPVVIALAHQGKAAFLKERSAEIAALLAADIAVCLPDLSGTGEIAPEDSDRDQYSTATDLSATSLMLGTPILGHQWSDLVCVIQWLEKHPGIDAKRIGLWGDSFTEPNPADANLHVPRRVDDRPRVSEPMGGVLALYEGLRNPNVRAIYMRNGVTSISASLGDRPVCIPHDAQLPEICRYGDLPYGTALLAPKPLCLAQLVDEHNQRVSAEKVRAVYASAVRLYEFEKAADKLVIAGESPTPAAWFSKHLGK